MGAPIRTKEEKEYIVIMNDDTRKRITVPEGCKITFGAFQNPGTDRYGNSKAVGGATLRIYEGGEGVQLMCLPGVKEFFTPTNIKIEELKYDESSHTNEWVEWDAKDDSERVAKALMNPANWQCNRCDINNAKTRTTCGNCGNPAPWR